MTKRKTARTSAKEGAADEDHQVDLRRNAGILLHVTSLPSAFGSGDLGPQARAFANFLSRAGQTYWQLLPLNPAEAGRGYSPYSALSSMAGNTLLISPEALVADGLLKKNDVIKYRIPPKHKADFSVAEGIRRILLNKAYENFKLLGAGMTTDFKRFVRREKHWLDDYALYTAIRQYHENKAWYQWPEGLRYRKAAALKKFSRENRDTLDRIKWLQFIFSRQWNALKSHCHDLNIRLFGDLPFYVSYDSADVWSHPDIFNLDSKGEMAGMAGVPPDYFSATGQLWGMPVFRWAVLQEQGYDWWLHRLRKNMELFDLLRLDHFRAFADYWEVPAGEKTAVHGQWRTGPGASFFDAVKKDLGSLPFVAEDLGDINDAVYALRDRFALPGMKVLQFAFDKKMAESGHIPHNYQENFIAYTGTHDNNTTRGWFKHELKASARRRVASYCGQKTTAKNAPDLMARTAYASVARTVILPMQDVLGLGKFARMNTPGSAKGNWLWRLRPGDVTSKHEKKLREWCAIYNRLPSVAQRAK